LKSIGLRKSNGRNMFIAAKRFLSADAIKE
jgi:hypothetical protein